MAYPAIEEAIRTRLRDHYSLDDPLVVTGNLDLLFDTLQTSNASQGVLLEFGHGQRLHAPPFNGKMWEWSIEGYYLIRYEGDSAVIEAAARAAIEKLFSVFDEHGSLGGIAALVKLVEVVRPDPVRINDIPFYWIPFGIEALEKI